MGRCALHQRRDFQKCLSNVHPLHRPTYPIQPEYEDKRKYIFHLGVTTCISVTELETSGCEARC